MKPSPSLLQRAVIWDLDGTLIDSSASHWRAWHDELLARGRELAYEEFSSSFGQRNDSILRMWLESNLTDLEIAEISASKEARYRQWIRAEGIYLLPGVKRWLRELSEAGWRQAVGTMTSLENVNVIFEVLEERDSFDRKVFQAVVTAEEVKLGKPDPEVFLKAAARLGVEPERCVVVEDAPSGIEAAHRSGMRAIAVGENAASNADLAAPNLTCLSLADWDSLVSPC